MTSSKGSSTSLAKESEKELLAKQVKVIDEKKKLIQDETVEKGSVCITESITFLRIIQASIMFICFCIQLISYTHSNIQF